MKDFLKINPADNVAVAINPLAAGTTVNVDGDEITLVSDIPAGHKFALRDIADGENVIKYGFPIGHTRHEVKRGAFLDHNDIKTNLEGQLDYSDITIDNPSPEAPGAANKGTEATFMGYERPDGQVGIRNEIWVIPTVGCVNGIAKQIVDRLNAETKAEGVDGIFAFPTTTAAHSSATTTRTPRRFSATWCSTPTQVVSSSSVSAARTTSPRSSRNSVATTTAAA